jgi:hypothetical protein
VVAPPQNRVAWAVACCLLVALPFLVVAFPPLTDLGQHTAQVRLFLDTLGDPQSPYRIQWLTPYGLGYLAVAFGWLLGGPLAAGRLGALLLVVSWVAAVHLLARYRRRPVAAAVAAGVLVFNHTLYWGFLSFLAGWPIFVLWFLWTERPPLRERRWIEALVTFLAAAVLYLAHALWFAVGMAWLTVAALRARRHLRAFLPRLLGAVPVAVWAAVWFAGISNTGFSTPPLWLKPASVRLAPSSLVDAALGGLRGSAEPLLLAVLLAWIGIAAWQSRKDLVSSSDVLLAALGAAFVVAALVLPDKLTNTIEFNDRWMPAGWVCLLLAAPPLRASKRLLAGAALSLLAAWCLLTAGVWRQVEQRELAGLGPALAALPESPRLLGLDFVRRSALLKGQPFFQCFAYGQALRGGRLSFSFAEFPPSPVVFRPHPSFPWTPGLEWYPQRVRRQDLLHFDDVLVNAPPQVHRQLEADPLLEALTPPAPWRLYAVRPEALRAQASRPPLNPAAGATPTPRSEVPPPPPRPTPPPAR